MTSRIGKKILKWIGVVLVLLLLGTGITVGVLKILPILREPKQVRVLKSQLSVSDPERQKAALVQLIWYGSAAKRALPLVRELAKQEEEEDLAQTASAARYVIAPEGGSGLAILMNMLDPDVMKGLNAMAVGSDPKPRAVALAAIGWKIHSTIRPIETPFMKVDSKVVDPDIDQAVAVLRRGLSDSDVGVRRASAMSLACVAHRSQMIPVFSSARSDLHSATADQDSLTRGLAKIATGEKFDADDDTKAASKAWKDESLRFLEGKWVPGNSFITRK